MLAVSLKGRSEPDPLWARGAQKTASLGWSSAIRESDSQGWTPAPGLGLERRVFVPLEASAGTDDLMGEELCPASNCCSKLDGRQRAAGKGVRDNTASLLAGGWGRKDAVVAAKIETKCFLT